MAAGASGALNMAYDSDIDAADDAHRHPAHSRWAISRAKKRWPSAGRCRSPSVAIMGLFVNCLAAGLLAFTIFFYVVVYTLWLKRRTPQNIVIGGLAGALPPAIGWAAVTGSLSLAPLLLVLIIFMWTPPHFWALSLYRSRRLRPRRRADAAGGEGQSLDPPPDSCLRACCSRRSGLLPAFIGLGGPLYLAVSAACGAWVLLGSCRDLRETDETREPAAHRLFGVSLALSCFVLFAALIAERLIGLAPLSHWI